MFHIGDEPTKKDTGELEEILPSWLKDARQQSKEETGGDATLRSETKPKVQRNEAPDLLAGLISQADSDDDEVPDWLASINPVVEKTPAKSSSAKEDGPSDFFAQFKQSETPPSKPAVSEPAQDDTPAWMNGMEKPASAPKDELADWLSQTPAETTSSAFVSPAADDNSWINNLGSFDDAAQTPAEKEPEDLSWLHDLENSAKQPDSSSTSSPSAGFDFAPSSAGDGDDLSWLNNLGGISVPSFEQPAQPSSSNAGDDMSWLNNLGGASTPAPSFEQPAQSKPASSDEDLSWLNTLGGTPASSFEEPVQSKPASSGEDLSWLNNLGDTTPSFEQPAQSKPASSDEDLSWLNNLGGTSTPSFEQPAQSKPASSDEDLSWLNNLGGTPASSFEEPAQPASSSQGDLDWLSNLGDTSTPAFEQPAQPASSSQEDLDWLSNLGGTSTPSFEQPAQPASSSQEDLDWLSNLGGASTPAFEQPAQPASSSQEDLDWLSNLGGTSTPSFEQPAQPASSSQDDLDWLSNLGGASTPAFEQPAQPALSSQEDLDWLSNLGGTSTPSFEQPAQPASSSQEDLDWLSNLGGTSTPAFEQPAQPASASQEDLDWLSNLGGTSTPAFEQPAQPVTSSQDDLDWLSNLGGVSTPAFEQPKENSQPVESGVSKPFQTAPLNELFKDNDIKDANPDWLKSALEEEPSMPSLDDLSVGRRSEQEKPSKAFDERPASSQPAPASPQPAFTPSFGGSSTPSSADVDSLFNIDMPDWLSREAENVEASQSGVDSSSSAGDASLAPVELPSWVQAMRPVGSSIDSAIPSTVDQITEREGPLAGFSGVIPSAPIGSALRPKAFSLKLQVTDEQQAGASLFERILASETTAQTLKSTSAVSSQRMLRWALSAIFILVLALVIGFGSQSMPIVPANQLSDLVATIPDSSSVLVVMDYEPSLAGELEATGGPLLNQLALARRSAFTFIATSPTGSALVDRLVSNTIIKPTPKDLNLKYELGAQYFNIGFLPGGSAGVLGFITDPAKTMPVMSIDKFSAFQAIILMTDNAESGRVWVEQLEIAKSKDASIAEKPVFVVSSAQSAPMLQPYASSGQVDIVINGLYDAAKYEYVNTSRPGIARGYWDAFGVGLFMAITAIVLGSVWSILVGIRERRAQAEQG
ncbi:MAG: hypothetical protein IPP66_11755 [Anaerolineales bacterium]|nr:hypothetical protein [Anaerolineales bacterium]